MPSIRPRSLTTRLSTMALAVTCSFAVSPIPASATPEEMIRESFRTPLVGPPGRSSNLDDFNVRTTTDTEVRRLRTVLTRQLLEAAVNRTRAKSNLDDRQNEQQQRRNDRRQALDAVSNLERITVDAAVSQFMSSQSDQQAPRVPLQTDNLAEGTLSSYAIDQLRIQRLAAAELLEQADLDVNNAAARVRHARAQLSQAKLNLQSKREQLAAFDRRADEHRQVAAEADRRAAAQSSEINLRSVAGTLVVNATIEADIDRLLADARLNGHDLSGGGFRTTKQQIRLRLAHCDTDHQPENAHDPTDAAHVNYVVNMAPANTCAPPTAPPGRSQHQTGLAIDFTESGRILTKASAGYQWLVDNASTYGLFNLPSEPWHWSTTGQ